MAELLNREIADNDRLEIIGRKKLAMTGVDAVEGFTEQTLNLTVAGVKMRISGENIKITSYNKTTGNLTADGVFSEIKYMQKNTPLIKKIFK